MTKLGAACPATCAIYGNGCNVETSVKCTDSSGDYLNHLANPKTCEWLHNDKGSDRTDRKDKNCGYGSNPMTKLGAACPATCAIYGNGCNVETSVKCTDSSGDYLNPLANPKTCEWLHNDKGSDR